MLQPRSIHSGHSFRDKLLSIDYVLVLSVLVLGIISMFAMYSTDGGEVLYHTKSHFMKLIIFFPLMIIISFFNIKFWHTTSYLLYFIIILKNDNNNLYIVFRTNHLKIFHVLLFSLFLLYLLLLLLLLRNLLQMYRRHLHNLFRRILQWLR